MDENIVFTLLFIFAVLYLLAYILAMGIIAESAREKGHEDLIRRLWFIGLITTPATAGVIVAGLRDKVFENTVASSASPSQPPSIDQLPSI